MEPSPSPPRSASRSRQARQLALAGRLRPNRWRRAEDLAQAFDVSVRTIYRDMEALAKAGVPIVAVPGKGYRLEDDSPREASLSGLPLHHPAAEWKAEALPPQLQQAVGEQQSLQFRNGPTGSEQAAPRRLDPYALARRGGRWVLIGYDHHHEKVRHIRLDATASWEPMPETSFERPAGYGAEEVNSAPRDQIVRVQFAPPAAGRVRRAPPLHTERVEEHGEVIVLTLRVRRLAAVVPWLLGWGRHARVLSPATLRRRIADEARRLAAQYDEAPALIG